MTVDIYNTGNKYKTIYMDPPWAEQGGGSFEESMIGYTYETFMKIAESKFEDFIMNSHFSSKYNLVEKANKPLHIW